jgi:DMSO/TMAO reductase YedYZ molybdopterin-dependent catalytic subunit
MSFDEIVDERAREEETLIAAGLKQEPLPPGEPVVRHPQSLVTNRRGGSKRSG